MFDFLSSSDFGADFDNGMIDTDMGSGLSSGMELFDVSTETPPPVETAGGPIAAFDMDAGQMPFSDPVFSDFPALSAFDSFPSFESGQMSSSNPAFSDLSAHLDVDSTPFQGRGYDVKDLEEIDKKIEEAERLLKSRTEYYVNNPTVHTKVDLEYAEDHLESLKHQRHFIETHIYSK